MGYCEFPRGGCTIIAKVYLLPRVRQAMPDHEFIASGSAPAIGHLGTYRRLLPVGLERMYENVLDWAHLPFVHASTFSAVRPLDFGSWGWRAEVANRDGRSWTVAVDLDRRCQRWVTRNLDGAHAGAEVWTQAFAIDLGELGERLQVVVDFFLPGVAEPQRDKVFRGYARLYETLYDEDVAMMSERQRQIDRRIEGSLGATVEVGRRQHLVLPRIVTLAGRDYVLAEVDATLVAYPARCPHQLGPLSAMDLVNGAVSCPWHGYRFDVVTGACLSGQACQLQPLPLVQVADDGLVSLQLPGADVTR